MEIKPIVICSGYYDPLHEGHIEQFQLAKKLGDKLIVIVNNRDQCLIKNGREFIPEKTRCLVIGALKPVDDVFLSIDTDRTVCKSLEKIRECYNSKTELIFAKGGDRTDKNIPEADICDKLNIKIVFGLGEKINASSKIRLNFLNGDIK